MADKENKWEDMEYSDDEMNQSSEDQEYDDNEYSDEEYEDDDNSSEEYEDDENAEDEEYEDDDDRPQKKGFPIILVILVILILLAVGGFLAYSKLSSGGMANNGTPIQQENFDNNQDNNNAENSGDMGDFFFNEAGGNESDMMSVGFNENGETNVATDGNGENVATVTDQTDTKANDLSPDDIFSNGGLNADDDENNAIMVSYNKALRLNPFKPPVAQKSNEYADVNNTDFEIIEPPSTSNPDENLKRLLQTQISGIMYDDVSPSAIVNLNGVDQFVKIGDVVSGYKIENITKNKVQISYKNNSYVASVGELFTRGYVEKQQAVVNLEHKFAGRYRNN